MIHQVNGEDYYEISCDMMDECSMQPKQDCLNKEEVCKYSLIGNGSFFEEICEQVCPVVKEEVCKDIYENQIVGYKDARSLSNAVTSVAP